MFLFFLSFVILTRVFLSWIPGDALTCRTCRVGIMGKCLFSGAEVCSQSEPNCHSSQLGECRLPFASIFEWSSSRNKEEPPQAGGSFTGVRLCRTLQHQPQLVGKTSLSTVTGSSRTLASRASARFDVCLFVCLLFVCCTRTAYKISNCELSVGVNVVCLHAAL